MFITKKQKMVGGGVVGLLLLWGLFGQEEATSLPWTDKLIPVIEVRCLTEVDGVDAPLLARQKFCKCVTNRFKKTWRSDEVFKKDMNQILSAYISAEDRMKTQDRNDAIRLTDSEVPAFLREVLLRLGLKWSGERYEKYQANFLKLLDPVMESSKRSCIKVAKP